MYKDICTKNFQYLILPFLITFVIVGVIEPAYLLYLMGFFIPVIFIGSLVLNYKLTTIGSPFKWITIFGVAILVLMLSFHLGSLFAYFFI